MIPIRSATKKASNKSCVTRIHPIPSCLIISIILLRSCVRFMESKLLKGSSNKRTKGSSAMARAMAVRCFSPPDISLGLLFFISEIPHNSTRS